MAAGRRVPPAMVGETGGHVRRAQRSPRLTRWCETLARQDWAGRDAASGGDKGTRHAGVCSCIQTPHCGGGGGGRAHSTCGWRQVPSTPPPPPFLATARPRALGPGRPAQKPPTDEHHGQRRVANEAVDGGNGVGARRALVEGTATSATPCPTPRDAAASARCHVHERRPTHAQPSVFAAAPKRLGGDARRLWSRVMWGTSDGDRLASHPIMGWGGSGQAGRGEGWREMQAVARRARETLHVSLERHRNLTP